LTRSAVSSLAAFRTSRIELHTLNLLPLNFELSFDSFHTVRECRVIWRQGDFVGVAFQN